MGIARPTRAAPSPVCLVTPAWTRTWYKLMSLWIQSKQNSTIAIFPRGSKVNLMSLL